MGERETREVMLNQRPEDGRGSFIAFVLVLVVFEIFLGQVLKIGNRDWSWAKTLAFAAAILIFGGVLRAFLERDRRNQ